MQLPYAERATAARAKIERYLLNLDHPDGGGKARFFRGHGYTPLDWERLARDLVRHGQTHPVAGVRPGHEGGGSYSVVGALLLPDGERRRVLTAWYIAAGDDTPYLSSAYPQD